MNKFNLGHTWITKSGIRIAFISRRMIYYMIHNPLVYQSFFRAESYDDNDLFIPIICNKAGEVRIYYFKGGK